MTLSSNGESLLDSLVNDENISELDAVAKVASNRNKGKITREEEALILNNLGLL